MLDIIPPDATPLKRCSRCPEGQQWHPATMEYFQRDRSRKDGLYYLCKACCAIRDAHKRSLHKPVYKRKVPRKKEKISEVPEGMKQCTKCGDLFPATPEFFKRDKHTKDGLYPSCKTCWKEARNVEQDRESCLQYYYQHKEKLNQDSRQYQLTHKEEIKVQRRGHYFANQEVESERRRQYDKTERGRAVAQASRHRRRAREKDAEGTLTAQQIQDKLKAQRYRCYYAACGFAKFEKKDGKYIYHIEHTIPVSRIEANPRNDINYVVLACPSCNNRKHRRLPHEFFEGGRLF